MVLSPNEGGSEVEMSIDKNIATDSPYTVYVVDDNNDLLRLLIESLRFSDFSAKGFTSVEELVNTCFPTGFSTIDCC